MFSTFVLIREASSGKISFATGNAAGGQAGDIVVAGGSGDHTVSGTVTVQAGSTSSTSGTGGFISISSGAGCVQRFKSYFEL